MSTFPISPTIGQVYTGPAGQEWQWNGYAWEQFPQYAGETGATGPTGATGATGTTGGIQNGATGATGTAALTSGVVARNGAQTLPSVGALMNFLTEDFDLASEWNGTRFTASSSGYYSYYAQMCSAQGLVTMQITTQKNGSNLSQGRATANERMCSIKGIVALNSGDYLEFFGALTSTFTIDNSLFNYISIYKL